MILTKGELVSNIKRDIADNSVGDISPGDIRDNLLNVIDSIHILSQNQNISSNNLDTFNDGNTRLGLETLRKAYISGYNSVNNTAIGYRSLTANAQGERNTSIGSNSLACNINGSDNVAAGFHALAGNTIGIGNIGLGNYGLNFNRVGNFNIAIGHGAGYYVSDNDDYQFFLASHNIDDDYICSNPSGLGLAPLLIGDLRQSNLQLGVGVPSLHAGASLQVSGNIHPYDAVSSSDIGSSGYLWRSLYLGDSIYFKQDYISYNASGPELDFSTSIISSGDGSFAGNFDIKGNLTSSGTLRADGISTFNNDLYINDNVSLSGNILPARHRLYNLGNAGSEIHNLYTHNLNLTGKATIKALYGLEQSHFAQKTLHLASSGDVVTFDGGGAAGLYSNYDITQNHNNEFAALFNDEELVNAGIELKSKGLGYERTYKLGFKPQDSVLNYLTLDNAFSRSSWLSNISLSLSSGVHLETNRIIHKSNFSLSKNDNGLGIHTQGNKTYFTYESNSSIPFSGDGNYNITPRDGDTTLNVILGLNGSGNISQKFINNISANALDGNFFEYDGFDISYITDSTLSSPSAFNEQFGQEARRFVIRSFNGTSSAKRSLVFMQDNSDGVLGVNNFINGDSLLPDTIFNIRATGDAIARITAENSSNSKAKLELLYGDNSLTNGIDFEYHHNSGTFTINKYVDDTQYPIFVEKNNDRLGFLIDDISNSESVLSLGVDASGDSFFAIAESSGVPSGTAGYGTLYIRHNPTDSTKSSTLNMVDSSGNIFAFLVDATDEFGDSIEKSLIVDQYGNTFGGRNSPNSRSQLTSNTANNTAIGNSALASITNGSQNTVVGYGSLDSITNGSTNIVIGYNCLSNTTNASGNLIIGNNVLSSVSSDVENRFIIGDIFDGYTDTKDITMPDGSLAFKNTSLQRGIKVSNSSIEKVDYIGALSYPTHSIDFKFTSSSTATLMTLNHASDPMSRTPTYSSSDNPFVEIKGDIKLLGGVSFSDNTYVDTASFLTDIDNLESRMNTAESDIDTAESNISTLTSRLDNLIIECVAINDIPAPVNDRVATTGSARIKIVNESSELVDKTSESLGDPSTITIHNRDPRMPIDAGDYVLVIKVNNEYRPVWISGPRLT